MDDKSFVLYKASAGSGKTYTLIKEFLILCFNHDEKYYKEILAVTFTNKAANEMKVKILDNLKGIICKDSDFSNMIDDLTSVTGLEYDEIRKKAERLYSNIIHNYSDLSISTIDSFVQQISRSFAKELNLPSQYRVLIDKDELLDEVVKRIDKKIGDSDDLMTEVLSEYVEYKINKEENDRIENPIKTYLNKLLKESAYKKGESFNIAPLDKEQYGEVKLYLADKVTEFEKDIRTKTEELEAVIREYHITEDCYMNKSRGLISILDKVHKADANLKELEPSSLINTAIRKMFKTKTWVHSKAPKDVIDRINKDNINILKYYQDIVKKCNLLYFTNMLRDNIYLDVLRGKLMEIINEFIIDTNKVHISEFNKRISDVLGDCSVPFIYERIGARYRHFFIDEFQDTSILQWFNFLPLVNNSLSSGNRNLLVGDAKQAIYRFRGGEVEQIIKLPKIHKKDDSEFAENCQSLFENSHDVKNLKVNYRTKKNIVNFNNEFFDFAKDKLANDLYHKVYKENMRQETRPKDYDGYVNVEIFKKECFLNDKKKFDVRQYKDAVKQSMHKQISELIEKGYNYKDITILVRNNSDGTEIAEFMTRNEKKIPVISSDSILITSSDKVMLMITALRYIADENNMVAKLSLAYYMDACKTPDADKRELGKAVDNIDNINLDRIKDNTMSLYDVCSQIAKSYDLNIADDIFLQYFMNVVIEWQNSEHGNINDFVEYWDKRSNSFSVMITSDVDAVQIMTIHKSKGLEFKVVMYPYAYTYLPDKVRQSEKWLSYKTDFPDVGDVPHMDNFILPINKSLLNTIFESHYIEEKESASFDDLNIMYVAMTRPKDLLFVYTNDETSSEHDYNLFVDYMNSENNQCTMMSGQLEEDKSYVYVLGEICWNYIKEDKDTGNDILEFTDKNHGETINWTDVLKVDQDTVVITADDKEYNSQEWGILVHEILSKINTKDDARRVMTPYLFSGVIDKKQSEFLLKQFEKIISIEKIKDAYSERCIVKNEMEILTKECEILRPDRYVELPDKIMVIDYKTGKHDDKYYKKQQDYIIALQDMGVKKNIEGYLLYIGDEVCVKPVYIDRLF